MIEFKIGEYYEFIGDANDGHRIFQVIRLNVKKKGRQSLGVEYKMIHEFRKDMLATGDVRIFTFASQMARNSKHRPEYDTPLGKVIYGKV